MNLAVLVIRAIRPERALLALEKYVLAVFGDSFDWHDHFRLDLQVCMHSNNNSDGGGDL